MAYQLILLEEADKEYQEAAQWYESNSKDLGFRFIDIIEKKLQIIQEYPERFPKRNGNFRETPVKIFPYIIVYTCYKTEGIRTVNSIFHSSRNPRKKYNRNKKRSR